MRRKASSHDKCVDSQSCVYVQCQKIIVGFRVSFKNVAYPVFNLSCGFLLPRCLVQLFSTSFHPSLGITQWIPNLSTWINFTSGIYLYFTVKLKFYNQVFSSIYRIIRQTYLKQWTLKHVACDNRHPGKVHLVQYTECKYLGGCSYLSKSVKVSYYNIHHIAVVWLSNSHY